MDYVTPLEKVSNASVSEVMIKMQVDKKVSMEIFNAGFNGVYLSESVSRYYPYGDLLTQIIGFTTIDNI